MNYPSKWREVHLRECGRYRIEYTGGRWVAQYLASQKQQLWTDIAIKDGLSQAMVACSDHMASCDNVSPAQQRSPQTAPVASQEPTSSVIASEAVLCDSGVTAVTADTGRSGVPA